MRMVEIVAVQGDQDVAAGFSNGAFSAGGFATRPLVLFDVAKTWIVEPLDQGLQVGLIAVVVDHDSFPVLQALAEAAGQRRPQFMNPIASGRNEADQRTIRVDQSAFPGWFKRSQQPRGRRAIDWRDPRSA